MFRALRWDGVMECGGWNIDFQSVCPADILSAAEN
jgi:hypothetical protein